MYFQEYFSDLDPYQVEWNHFELLSIFKNEDLLHLTQLQRHVEAQTAEIDVKIVQFEIVSNLKGLRF